MPGDVVERRAFECELEPRSAEQLAFRPHQPADVGAVEDAVVADRMPREPPHVVLGQSERDA